MNSTVQHKKFAFSLIELMVVIAIIAVLAAIAVPAYNRYVIGARIASIVPVVDGIMEQMIEYANANGYFPNAYQLGLGTATVNDGQSVDSPVAVNPYLSSITIVDLSNTSTPCGQYGYVTGSFIPSLVGLPATSYEVFFCDLWHYNGVIYKLCTYAGSNKGHSFTGSYIPGWVNYFSNSNYGRAAYHLVIDDSTYNDATCM